MGCAPSKQSGDAEVDPDKQPYTPSTDAKPQKNKKSPKKGKAKPTEDGNLANNNAKDAAATDTPETKIAPAVEDEVRPVEEVMVAQEVSTVSASPVATSPASPSSLNSPTKDRGDLWDLRRGMPPQTSPYDEDAPPKPPRHVAWDQTPDRGKDACHTFPRRYKARPVSARERSADAEEGTKSATLERKLSLRERTPERRKDLDLSGNIFMGKMLELPGRGKVLPAENVDFLQPPEVHVVHVEDTTDATLPKGSVKEIANAFLELTKKKEEDLKPKPPIKHVKRAGGSSTTSDDGLGDDWEVVEAGDGDHSVIETVNKQILNEYKTVPRKTFEEIEEERLERVAEEERIRAEEERIRAEEEARRLAEEAERERLRLEEEARRLAEEAERERVRQEEEAKRLAEEAEAERIRAEEEAKRLAEEAEQERIQAEEEAKRLAEQADREGGDDPAAVGAAQEDRFYNNKAFEKPDIDASDPQQQEAALKIQTKYRQHHAKEVVGQKRQEVAVVKIQAGYRGWQDRKRVSNMRAQVDAESKAADEEVEQQDAQTDELPDLNNPEVEAAATTIQAGFKGYKARREVQALKSQQAEDVPQEPVEEAIQEPVEESTQEVAPEAEPQENLDAPEAQATENLDAPEAQTDATGDAVDINLDDPEVSKAATKIQASFKGYMVRKERASQERTPDDGQQEGGEQQTSDDAPQEASQETAQETGQEEAPQADTTQEETAPQESEQEAVQETGEATQESGEAKQETGEATQETGEAQPGDDSTAGAGTERPGEDSTAGAGTERPGE